MQQLIQNLVWLFWISKKGLDSVERRSSLRLLVDFEIEKRFAGLVEAEKEGRFLVIRAFFGGSC